MRTFSLTARAAAPSLATAAHTAAYNNSAMALQRRQFFVGSLDRMDLLLESPTARPGLQRHQTRSLHSTAPQSESSEYSHPRHDPKKVDTGYFPPSTKAPPENTVNSPEPSGTADTGASANPRSNVTDPQDEKPAHGGPEGGARNQQEQLKANELQDGSGQLMPGLTKGILDHGIEAESKARDAKNVDHKVGRGIRGEDTSALKAGRKVQKGKTPGFTASDE